VDRQFDYTQKILLAVEFADAPRRMDGMPASYAVFKRLSIPEVLREFGATASSSVPVPEAAAFRGVLEHRMGFWEKKVPAGQQCFVHYAIGSDDTITAAYNRLKSDGKSYVLLGIYHVEPQSSAWPFSFPSGDTPDHWYLGEHFSLTRDSIFWFNFFPEQPYVFEKTFAIWAIFQTQHFKAKGENNQLVAWEGKERLLANGVSEFVLVNLNRFTSLQGFANSAREAGKHTFTDDTEYIWYGMLLRKM